SLIKTVSRRGYLLNTVVTTDRPDQIAVKRGAGPRRPVGVLQRVAAMLKAGRLDARLAVAAVAGLVLLLSAIFLFGRHSSITGVRHLSIAAHGSAAIAPRPGFRDCADCPEMVALTSGEFMMGSPVEELGHQDVEGVPRRVTIAKPFAIGKFEVTVDQFSAFVADTGMTAGNSCQGIAAYDRSPTEWGPPEGSFRIPGSEVA